MKIEIIIPAYNCTKTLHRTLSSLGAQTDADFSVHVIDDCSTEDLMLIIEKHRDLNIRVTRNKENKGCGMTRQVGIDSTVADYITFLDSDDVLMPYAIETWKDMANDLPDIDIFHSYFYEQTIVEDEPAMILHKDGFTWCHGKLYKVDFIKKWGIKNSPEVKYADDSFFNSMCTELGVISIIPIAMYMWLNNETSITRSGNFLTNKNGIYDFINAMCISIDFLKEKGINEIKHLPNTIENLNRIKHLFDEKTNEAYNKLLSYQLKE